MFIASSKGRSGLLWLVLGFILGPLGVLLILILPSTLNRTMVNNVVNVSVDNRESRQTMNIRELTKKCPSCAETIKLEAIKCRYCGERFDSQNLPDVVDLDEVVSVEKNEPARFQGRKRWW
jgi:hypothetical protein